MIFGSRYHTALHGCAAAALMAFIAPVAAHAQEATYSFNIPSQDLGAALRDFARAARQQVVFDSAVARGKRNPALVGTYSANDGLARLLAGSGLVTRKTPAGVIYVEVAAPQQSGAPEEPARATAVEELVVTGTNIRGAAPASPIIVFDKQAIARTGYASARELITSLPQNFGGGAAETTGPSPNIDAGRNVGATSTVDLRGLGAGSTLTLLNGHRLAPNGEGFAADISAIPLSAIKRVEILTDGASAIYGSDAVGGVVNFILNDTYEGGETLAQYGGATRGGAKEARLAQTVGHRWGTGGLIATYEYYSRTPALAGDRPFASELPADFKLTADQHRNSGFVHADQEVGPIKFFGDLLYSDQRKELITLFDTREQDHLTTLSAALGASASLGHGWALEANGLYGRQTDDQVATTTEGDSFPTDDRDQVTSLDAKADGPLFHLPGGDVRAAIGGSARRDRGLRRTLRSAGRRRQRHGRDPTTGCGCGGAVGALQRLRRYDQSQGRRNLGSR